MHTWMMLAFNVERSPNGSRLRVVLVGQASLRAAAWTLGDHNIEHHSIDTRNAIDFEAEFPCTTPEILEKLTQLASSSSSDDKPIILKPCVVADLVLGPY